MSETAVQPEILQTKIDNAVLHMNGKLREQGFSERERAFLWGMTVSEMRVFLNTVWEAQHNEKVLTQVGEEPVKVITEAKVHSIDLVAEEPGPAVGVHPIEKPTPKPPKNKLNTDG